MQINPTWKTRRVKTPMFGTSIQVWSTQRKVWMHMYFER